MVPQPSSFTGAEQNGKFTAGRVVSVARLVFLERRCPAVERSLQRPANNQRLVFPLALVRIAPRAGYLPQAHIGDGPLFGA